MINCQLLWLIINTGDRRYDISVKSRFVPFFNSLSVLNFVQLCSCVGRIEHSEIRQLFCLLKTSGFISFNPAVLLCCVVFNIEHSTMGEGDSMLGRCR